MTAMDAVHVAQGYARLLFWNFGAFLVLSLGFGGLTILSPEIRETLPYADMRKLMVIGYGLPALALVLAALHFCARMNAALEMAGAMAGAEAQAGEGVFRPLSVLWLLTLYPAIIIVVSYTLLIYAVDGGLF